MSNTTNTALSTALQQPQGFQDSKKPRKPGRERGVWLEHGKWAASAGKNPATGERIRAYGFDTKTEAREWRAKEIAKLASMSTERRQLIRKISENEAVDAAEALNALHNAGFSGFGLLKKAVDEFIARHPEVNPTTVGEFYDTWIKLKEQRDRRQKTIQSAKNNFGGFLRKHREKALVEIKLCHVEEHVFDPAVPNPTTRRNRGVIITNFFNEAQARGLIGPEAKDHPCNALVLPGKPEGNPDPWPIEDFEKLLKHAWDTEDRFHCTAFILLGAFAGIRTEELLKMRFGPGKIDIDSGIITVGADTAKKRRTRSFEMLPELKDALVALRDRARVRQKYWRPLPRPTDIDSKVISPKLLAAFKKTLTEPTETGGAGLPIVSEGGQMVRAKNGTLSVTEASAWHDNGLRSSFATYHFERFKEPRLTSAIMGHTGDLNIFFNHYRQLAKIGDGERFFSIPAKIFCSGSPPGPKATGVT